MWRLKCASDSNPHPYLRSLNDFEGRQVWEFDAHGGTSAEREAIKRAQDAFTANRLNNKHSSDLLLRLQCTGNLDEKSNSRHGKRRFSLHQEKQAMHDQCAWATSRCPCR